MVLSLHTKSSKRPQPPRPSQHHPANRVAQLYDRGRKERWGKGVKERQRRWSSSSSNLSNGINQSKGEIHFQVSKQRVKREIRKLWFDLHKMPKLSIDNIAHKTQEPQTHTQPVTHTTLCQRKICHDVTAFTSKWSVRERGQHDCKFKLPITARQT